MPSSSGNIVPDAVIDSWMAGHLVAAAPSRVFGCSLWTGDTSRLLMLDRQGRTVNAGQNACACGIQSLALIPFPVEGPRRGLLQLGYRQRDSFTEDDLQVWEAAALTLGIALALRAAQEESRERSKEMAALRAVAEEEKNRLQGQLRHADRLATIGQLAAGAAHELNEPLGSVLGFAQLAKNCSKLPVQVDQDIDKIINAALHAREIIKKLMVFARQMPTRKSPCNLNDLVREGLYFLESRCACEGIRMVRHLEETLPEVMVDPAQLHQVLVNLVVNAIQAMPEGGTLAIRTRSEDRRILLDIEDSGIGMTREILGQLFTPFFTTKGIGQGTGLGLSVVQGIVTAHGGTILVDSQPGKGSRFTVILPAGDPPKSQEFS